MWAVHLWVENFTLCTNPCWIQPCIWNVVSTWNSKVCACLLKLIYSSYTFYYDKLSIRWLVKKHRDMKATKVLARILQTTEKDVEEEIDDIRATIMSKEKQHVRHILRVLFTWKSIQRFVSHVTVKLRMTKILTFHVYRPKFCTSITAGYWLECVCKFSSELWVPLQYCKSEQF